MKVVFASLLVLFAVPAFAQEERVINQASDLVSWCKAQAEARYAAKNIQTYNWTASYHDSGNMLFVDGKLRAHDQDVDVHCSIASGAREEYGSVQIDDPTL